MIIFFSCKEEKVEPDTKIVLTVQDKGGSLVSAANVYLFGDEATFNTFKDASALGNPLPNNYLQAGISNASGEVSFGGLSGQQYWFYVQKGSTNNANSQFKLSSNLTEKATTYIVIQLEAFVTERVQFYSFDTNLSSDNEITIYNNSNGTPDQSSGFVISSFVTVGNIPDETGPSTVVFAPDLGTHTYYIKNKNGCVWEEEVVISIAEPSVQVELATCNVDRIEFSTSEASDITIYLNNNEQVGTVNSSGNLVIYRPIGTTYTYRAEHSNGTCTWINSVSPGDPVIVLDNCN